MTIDALIGKSLPSVTLESSTGKKVILPDSFKGKWTVIYFYPKDDTPGCTRQACSYRDNHAQFEKAGIEIVGVSADDLGSHAAFTSKYSLNFPLLADTEHTLSQALGVYGDQQWNGKTFKGLSRDSFLIDPTGKIREVWRKVSPDKTMSETLEAAEKYLK